MVLKIFGISHTCLPRMFQELSVSFRGGKMRFVFTVVDAKNGENVEISSYSSGWKVTMTIHGYFLEVPPTQ